MSLDYVRDPAEIYRRSFAEIEACGVLGGLDAAMHAVAVRIIHACGMPDIVDELRHGGDPVAAGRQALSRGAPVLCDVESVRWSIMRRLLPEGCEPECRIREPEIERHARSNGMTRAAAQIDLWGGRIAGAVMVIGNAPTALFRLLETIDAGGARPAVILGFPVGFVGAAESKAELASGGRGVPFISLDGRRGGSAIAAAAMNAVAAGLAT